MIQLFLLLLLLALDYSKKIILDKNVLADVKVKGLRQWGIAKIKRFCHKNFFVKPSIKTFENWITKFLSFFIVFLSFFFVDVVIENTWQNGKMLTYGFVMEKEILLQVILFICKKKFIEIQFPSKIIFSHFELKCFIRG